MFCVLKLIICQGKQLLGFQINNTPLGVMITPTDGYNIRSWKVFRTSESVVPCYICTSDVLKHTGLLKCDKSLMQQCSAALIFINRPHYMFRFGHECSEVVYCKDFNVFESHGVTDIYSMCWLWNFQGIWKSWPHLLPGMWKSWQAVRARSEASARCCLGKFFLPPGFQEVLQQQFVFHVKVSRLLKVEASGAGTGTHWSKQATVVFSL